MVPVGGLHAIPWSGLPSLAGRSVTLSPNAQLWLQADRRADDVVAHRRLDRRPRRHHRRHRVGGGRVARTTASQIGAAQQRRGRHRAVDVRPARPRARRRPRHVPIGPSAAVDAPAPRRRVHALRHGAGARPGAAGRAVELRRRRPRGLRRQRSARAGGGDAGARRGRRARPVDRGARAGVRRLRRRRARLPRDRSAVRRRGGGGAPALAGRRRPQPLGGRQLVHLLRIRARGASPPESPRLRTGRGDRRPMRSAPRPRPSRRCGSPRARARVSLASASANGRSHCSKLERRSERMQRCGKAAIWWASSSATGERLARFGVSRLARPIMRASSPLTPRPVRIRSRAWL